MKLITETIFNDVETLIEASENGRSAYYISGPYMNSEVQNRNGRMYPKPVLEGQVNNYQSLIREKRSIGELQHPNGPQINMDRVSHLVTELNWQGNDVHGKSKILDTPCGRIVKNFLDEGIKIGVSTRGLGSVKRNRAGMNEVQNDFRLVCIDIVNDPSGPSCFVNGIMEGASWVWDDVKGMWLEQAAEELVNDIEKNTRSRTLSPDQKLRIYERWLDALSGKNNQNNK